MINEPLELDGWRYTAEVDELGQLLLDVNSPIHKELPPSLYKLTELNDRSLDALENAYLFGAHPRYFNDLFDCHKNLVVPDSKESQEIMIEMMRVFYPDEIENWGDEELKENGHDMRTNFAYTAFGLLCLTPKPDNILMWAYYGNNKGFMTEYDYHQFPANFSGPFPINYQESISPISLKKHGDRVATLYQSLVKSKQWEHEDEWRFLCRSQENQILLPFGAKPNPEVPTHDRKFRFPVTAIKSITLGNRFFEIEEMVMGTDVLKVSLNDKDSLKKKLLEIVIERNLDIRIAMEQEDLKRIGFNDCVIERTDELNYKFTIK